MRFTDLRFMALLFYDLRIMALKFSDKQLLRIVVPISGMGIATCTK